MILSMNKVNQNHKESQWPWKAYTIILSLFIFRKFFILFYSKSPQFTYYFILRGIDQAYSLPYLYNVAQTIFNGIHFIVLFLYIYKIRLFERELWQSLFIFKVLFDITGHSFEIKYIISLFFYNPLICAFVAVTSIATYIPLYVACYRYAFK